MFPEALMLHYLDDLDSKMESMRAQFERESELETPWTSFNASLARPLLNTKKFLDKGPAAPAQPVENGILEDAVDAEPTLNLTPSNDDPATSADNKSAPVTRLDSLQQKFASHKVTPVEIKH
jgi:3'-5' exoribonuclease